MFSFGIVKLQRQLVAPERIWRWVGVEYRQKKFVVPLHFFGSASRPTISRFGKRFRDDQYAYNLVSFLFAVLYSRCPRCPAICKSGGGTCPPPHPMESAPLTTIKNASRWFKRIWWCMTRACTRVQQPFPGLLIKQTTTTRTQNVTSSSESSKLDAWTTHPARWRFILFCFPLLKSSRFASDVQSNAL